MVERVNNTVQLSISYPCSYICVIVNDVGNSLQIASCYAICTFLRYSMAVPNMPNIVVLNTMPVSRYIRSLLFQIIYQSFGSIR